MNTKKFFNKYKKEILDRHKIITSNELISFMFYKDIYEPEVLKDLLKSFLKDKIYVYNEKNKKLEKIENYDLLQKFYWMVNEIFHYDLIKKKNNFSNFVYDDDIIDLLMKINEEDIKYQLFTGFGIGEKDNGKKDKKYIRRLFEIADKYGFVNEIKICGLSNSGRILIRCENCVEVFNLIFSNDKKIKKMFEKKIDKLIEKLQHCLWEPGYDNDEFIDNYVEAVINHKVDEYILSYFIENAVEKGINRNKLFKYLLKILKNDKDCHYTDVVIAELKAENLLEKFKDYVYEIRGGYFNNGCVKWSELDELLDI